MWKRAVGLKPKGNHARSRTRIYGGAEIHRRIEGAAGPVKLIGAWLEDIQ
jgi:hypothetical protein